LCKYRALSGRGGGRHSGRLLSTGGGRQGEGVTRRQVEVVQFLQVLCGGVDIYIYIYIYMGASRICRTSWALPGRSPGNQRQYVAIMWPLCGHHAVIIPRVFVVVLQCFSQVGCPQAGRRTGGLAAGGQAGRRARRQAQAGRQAGTHAGRLPARRQAGKQAAPTCPLVGRQAGRQTDRQAGGEKGAQNTGKSPGTPQCHPLRYPGAQQVLPHRHT